MPDKAFYEKLKHAIKVARISRVARLTRMDYLGLPVFQCTRPFSRNMVTSQGKGFSEEKARISAIMESLEAFHGESIHAEKEALFSEIEPELGYDLQSLIPNIPNNATIKWVKGFDLIQEKTTYLPLALISLDFSDAYHPDLPTSPSSNGYGGGSTQTFALTHAILEILERHIVATAHPEYVPLNAEIDALLQPYFGALREKHFKMGIFNHPNEFGLPTIKVNIQEPGKTHTHFGMACHPDKNTALIKAFCEALQSRVTMISGARDDIEYFHYTSGESTSRVEMKLRQYDSIFSIKDYFQLSDSEKLTLLVNKIKEAGFQHLIFVDLTKPEINIPIVVAVVPGFQMSLHHQETSP